MKGRVTLLSQHSLLHVMIHFLNNSVSRGISILYTYLNLIYFYCIFFHLVTLLMCLSYIKLAYQIMLCRHYSPV